MAHMQWINYKSPKKRRKIKEKCQAFDGHTSTKVQFLWECRRKAKENNEFMRLCAPLWSLPWLQHENGFCLSAQLHYSFVVSAAVCSMCTDKTENWKSDPKWVSHTYNRLELAVCVLEFRSSGCRHFLSVSSIIVIDFSRTHTHTSNLCVLKVNLLIHGQHFRFHFAPWLSYDNG